MSADVPTTEDVPHDPLRVQFDVFLDEHRRAIHDCIDGLTEEQARRRLVSSQTTLLGLVKHATFVEGVWFGEAITGASRQDLGLALTPDASFVIEESDSIVSVQSAYEAACAASRLAVVDLALDDLLYGNRRGALPLRWVFLHVLREPAQHCGHADILREQVLTG